MNKLLTTICFIGIFISTMSFLILIKFNSIKDGIFFSCLIAVFVLLVLNEYEPYFKADDFNLIDWIIYICGGVLLIGFLGNHDPLITKGALSKLVDFLKVLTSFYILYSCIVKPLIGWNKRKITILNNMDRKRK